MSEQNEKKIMSIGTDDFKSFIEQRSYFVDKSLLIKEIIDSHAKATLIPRPRRFGKTLNLSMLRYFFEKSEESKRHLFSGLKIEEHSACMEHQGCYPVIWMTLKEAKVGDWTSCYEKLCAVIGHEFDRHLGAIKPILSSLEMERVQKIIAGTASQSMYENTLLDLSRYLERAYKKPVMLLIDEYDAPVHEGYLKGYYDKIVSFMRNFLGAGLKGNTSLEMGILTGILRVSKESIFSGINNLAVCTFLDERYADKFGFVENEVIEILNYFDIKNSIEDVRRWYDGYRCWKNRIYNPWSIINLVWKNGEMQPYWVNTSDNTLIKDLLKQSSPSMKEDLEIIVKGGKVTKILQDNIVLTEIDSSDEVLWNFLLFCGYLTFENDRRENDGPRLAELSVPNREVMEVYETSFRKWFESSTGKGNYQRMLECLVKGDLEGFQELFVKLTREVLSTFDVGGEEPEQFYHSFVLGMLVSLSQTYEVRSNRESGYGRYDVMLIPKDRTKPGIVIEFKKVREQLNETLEIAAQKALKQIEDRLYETELRAIGLHSVTKLGISFKGKESLVLIG